MGWSVFQGETTCGHFNKSLKVNEACLNVVSTFDTPLKFYTRNVECYECDFTLQGRPVAANKTTSYIIDTKYGFESYFYDGKAKYCEMSNSFEDFGVYSMNISQTECSDVIVVKEPEKFWANVGLSVCIYLSAFAVFWLLKYLYTHCSVYLSSSSVSLRELEMDLGNPNRREERKIRARRQFRMKSVDAFRGLAIIIMIFVNYGGGEYSVFRHTPWNGLSIADLVFPWFVWIMGASIVLSLRSSLRMSTSRKKIFWKILRRSCTLIALGIMLNSGKRDNGFLRVCGVLQRLGVTYFVVASIEILTAKPQRNEQLYQFGPWSYCQDLLDSWMQWILAISFTVAHEIITFLLQVPGCPTGYLGPGGFAEHSKYRNCTGGAAGYIDRLVITEGHMYHHGTFVKIYNPPVAYDPEGILGTFNSILCAFMGVHAARIILSFEHSSSRIRQWLVWATVTGIAAGFLCNWNENNGVIPVNKNLWSLSYVLTCSSLAFLILSLFYWLIDCSHVWNGFPFVYPGMNAITLYLGHSLLKTQLPWRWVPYTNTHMELLIMDIAATTIWAIISYVLFKSFSAAFGAPGAAKQALHSFWLYQPWYT